MSSSALGPGNVDSPLWYRLFCVGVRSAPLVEQPPQDSTGRWLDCIGWKTPVGEVTIDVPGKGRLGDCLNVVGGYDIISQRARDVLGELRIHPNVRFRDIVVVRSALNTREHWHWMNCEDELDVVDWDQSVVIKSPGYPGRGMVYRGVLDGRKLPPVDIFFGNTGFLYVSEALRCRFVAASLTGFSVEEVEVA